jgi:hypothetical protein
MPRKPTSLPLPSVGTWDRFFERQNARLDFLGDYRAAIFGHFSAKADGSNFPIREMPARTPLLPVHPNSLALTT